jgi:hypothetical protein
VDDVVGRAEWAALRAEVAALRRQIGRRRRRNSWRRVGALVIVAALTALAPLGLFAASFTDLNAGSPHNGNINAIADAGITKGCNPPTNDNYCPNDLVTREQMASFLARTAGLGGNPPVVNAKTAQTADTVVDGAITPAKLSATGSTAGQVLTSTGGGVTWQNASSGGSPGPQGPAGPAGSPGPTGPPGPSGAPASLSGNLIYTFTPGTLRTTDTLVSFDFDTNGALDVGISASVGTRTFFLPLSVPITLFNVPLKVVSVEICSFNGGGAGTQPTITTTVLQDLMASGTTPFTTDSTTHLEGGCYTVTPASAYALQGALALKLIMTFANTTTSFTFERIKVTMTP